jgi:hypothetical protein
MGFGFFFTDISKAIPDFMAPIAYFEKHTILPCFPILYYTSTSFQFQDNKQSPSPSRVDGFPTNLNAKVDKAHHVHGARRRGVRHGWQGSTPHTFIYGRCG